MWHDDRFNSAVASEAGRPLMPRPFGSRIVLAAELQQQLQALVRARSTPQALVFRCRLVLRAADDDGPNNQQIAAELGCDRHTVGLWRERFVAAGLAGLQDAPRSGRPRSFSPRRSHAGHQPGQ
ncbi:MAG TPA: helix-turn-helix domain-containing protein [Terriglobia bacterium]|nr:helix-turn-helix domain-containing protein [Terriglobia bacterium]